MLTPAQRQSLERNYGHGADKIYELLETQQDGRCAICKNQPSMKSTWHRLIIDHNHKTKEIRALLCRQCNAGLGNFRDDVVLLSRALTYLLQFKNRK